MEVTLCDCMDTFLILLSLFLIIFAGAGARRFNLLPEEASKYFNKFIFYISVPAVVFLSIATLDKGDLSSFLPFILTNIAVVFTGYILVYFILRYFNISADKKGVLIYSGNGGNVIYFGFPLLLSLYGAEHFNLGVMYGKGEGVAQDYREAVKWFRVAAEQGDASAQSNLGLMYAFGQGVAQDYVQAHMFCNVAAANGNIIGIECRDLLAKEMTSEQIAEAQKIAREWMVKHQQ